VSTSRRAHWSRSGVRVGHWSHHRNPPDRTAVALSVRLLHMMHQDTDEYRARRLNQPWHRQLRAEQRHERFHRQGETTAFPGSRHLA
jgi:hypothetical protein